jgi:4-hydroxybenzoate polyprenyltransferase
VISARLRYVTQLGRTALLGTTYIFVLLGVASGSGAANAGVLVVTLLATTAYHFAVYAANDVADLEIDRSQPRRAPSPLVQGLVSARAVAFGAGASALVAVAVAALQGAAPLIWMLIALALLLVYDAFGKRARWPLTTDVIQGFGWAALVYYGASASGEPTGATAWVGAYVVLAIVLINGIHGSLRDLPNDAAAGARTTALALGARPNARGGAQTTPLLDVYALTVQVAIVAVLLGGLVVERAATWALSAGVGGGAVAVMLMAFGLRVAGVPGQAWRVALVHILLLLTLPVLLVVEGLDTPLAIVLTVLFVLPWASVRAPLRRGTSEAMVA